MHRSFLFTLLILVGQIFRVSSITSYTYATADCSGDPVMIESFGNDECDPGTNNLLGVSTKTTCPASATGTQDHLLIQTFETNDCTGFPVMTMRYEANVCEAPIPGEQASVKYDCSYGNRIMISFTVALIALTAWSYVLH